MTRSMLVVVLLTATTACGSGAAVLRGDLLDEDGAADLHTAWVVGREGREPITESRFELRGVAPGVVDLRLESEEGESARMLIRDVPSGVNLGLLGIWIQRSSGLAFPTRIELRGDRVVTINGIRMAPPERLPARIGEDGVVLVLSDDGETMLVRPHDLQLPDLRVVVTPLTRTVSPDGDPAAPDQLTEGDTIHVEGTAEQGFVIASRLVLPRRSTLRSGQDRGGQARGRARGRD